VSIAAIGHRSDAKGRRAGLGLLLLGVAGLATAFWGLRADVGWIAQPFYAYAWWSAIFILDGAVALIRGHSLLTTRTRLVFPMGVWSITFWFFFEFLNLRFRNWYYVEVFPGHSLADMLQAGVFTAASFSTVFVGIFAWCEWLAALGRIWSRAPRTARAASWKFPPWVSYAVQAFGAAMALAALLSPEYLAPLIWGSFTFLVDPWNYRRGARSILRDMEAGDWGLVGRVFLAGTLCGLLWESLNFFAPQKWIYTVRGLESFKLFEMPLLGFFGFPALAFDALAALSLLSSLFLGNETWEHPGDLRYEIERRPRPPRWAFWASLPPQMAFWGLVSVLLMDVNIGSVQVEMEDLALDEAEVATLREISIGRPRQLLRAAEDPNRRREIEARLAATAARLDGILAEAELFTFKGIGSEFGRLLKRIGVRRSSDLRSWKPEELHARLVEESNRAGVRPPRLDWVRAWVLAGRDGGIVQDAR